jgi:hypothetical protein
MMSATEIISVINSLLLPKLEEDSPRTVFTTDGTLVKSQSMIVKLCEPQTQDLSCLYILFEFLALFTLSKSKKQASLTESFLDEYMIDQSRIKHYLEDPAVLENLYDLADSICFLVHQTTSQLRSLSESDNWQDSELLGNLIMDAVPIPATHKHPIVASIQFLQRDRTIEQQEIPIPKNKTHSVTEELLPKPDLLLKSLKVHLITWNVQGYAPNSERNIDGLFEATSRHKPDVVIIGNNFMTKRFRRSLSSKAKT